MIGLDNLTLYDGEEDLVGIAVYVFGYPGAGDVLLDQEAYRVEDISITNGIVSAVKEATLLDKPTTYLQTNAAINAGNSGGPMINDAGEIVGICTPRNIRFPRCFCGGKHRAFDCLIGR